MILATPTTTEKVRTTIALYEPSLEKLQAQQKVADSYRQGPTQEIRWMCSVDVTDALRLPVAMFVFGHTLHDHEEVAIFQLVAFAPFSLTLQKFKEVTPSIFPEMPLA